MVNYASLKSDLDGDFDREAGIALIKMAKRKCRKMKRKLDDIKLEG